ncbi:hypothetical protein C2845_PM13G09360 [Panicum miliaceum]|uniref:Uncharacterized protein n=1 Tax=Panicum miliaceum TaxID=4540 RepID=A0A3L6RFT6_PANMI|nr:hypothetical protein C2845_PM13G09360 [Panicum miliaceum]
MSSLSNLDPDPPSHRRRGHLSPLDPGVQRRPSMQAARAHPSPFRASCRHLFPSSAATTGQEDVGLGEVRRREGATASAARSRCVTSTGCRRTLDPSSKPIHESMIRFLPSFATCSAQQAIPNPWRWLGFSSDYYSRLGQHHL